MRFEKTRYANRIGAIKNKIAQDAGKALGANAGNPTLTLDPATLTPFLPGVRLTAVSREITAIPLVQRQAQLCAPDHVVAEFARSIREED